MAVEIVTGNHAAGYGLSVAGEANRNARGACCGIYPITPQTEIVEYVAKFKFTKGSVIPVESEHSAMGVCIGASIAGADHLPVQIPGSVSDPLHDRGLVVHDQ